MPPIIVNFTAIWLGPGRYRLTGQVLDESPGGLLVSFGGIPSAQGKTAVTNSDGYFELETQLQLDGTDAGYVTAVTQDRGGHSSNIAQIWIDPL
jgi:hypothetical protein